MHRTTRSAESRIRELELELSFPTNRNTFTTSHLLWMSRGGNHIIVGYLVHDDQCSNPLENDGSGKIIDAKFHDHIGRDSDGDPIIGPQLEYLERLGFVGTEEETDAAAKLLWDEAYARGRIGTPYARPLAGRHDGGYREWSTDCRKIDAVWIPDDSLIEHIESCVPEKRGEEAGKAFECALEEYNTWASGDCYGVCVDKFMRVDGEYAREQEDSCWGFIGADYAEESLDEEFNAEVAHKKKQLKQHPELPLVYKKPTKHPKNHCNP